MRFDEFYIWWLDQAQCESINKEEQSRLPPHIADELQSRWGRAGRGRLWSKVEGFEVNPWPDTAMARYLAEHSGGIVFPASDFDLLKDLPGIITDNKLNRV